MWFSDLDSFTPLQNGTVLALGAFDSLHKGQQSVLRATIEQAKARGVPSVVLSYAKESGEGKFLLSEEEKLYLLAKKQLRPDYFLSLPLEHYSLKLRAEAFAQDFLAKYFPGLRLCTGAYLQLGAERAALQDFLARPGLAQLRSSCELIAGQDELYSQAGVLAALAAANMPEVERLLGHPYVVKGTVVHGKALGRTVGMPTANLSFAQGKTMPQEGVYGSLVQVKGKRRLGLTNIGRRPSVDAEDRITIETFILDFGQDIYGSSQVLEIREHIRGVQAFANLTEVKKQVDCDIRSIKARLQYLAEQEE